MTVLVSGGRTSVPLQARRLKGFVGSNELPFCGSAHFSILHAYLFKITQIFDKNEFHILFNPRYRSTEENPYNIWELDISKINK